MFDEEYTVYCGNLSDQVTEEILFELFLQVGPVEDVRIPLQDGRSRSFGFVVFKHRDSVEYAINLFKDTKLFGKPLVLQNRLLQSQAKAKSRLGWSNGDYDRGYQGDSRLEEMAPLRKRSSHSNREDMKPRGSHSRHDDVTLAALRGAGSMGHSSRDDMKPRGSHSRHDDVTLAALRGAGSLGHSSRDDMKPRGSHSRHDDDDRPFFNHDMLRNIPPPHILPLLNSSWMPPSYPSAMLPYNPYDPRMFNESWASDRSFREASHRESSSDRHRHSEKRRHGSSRHHHRHSRSRSRDPTPENNHWKKSSKNPYHRH